MTDERIGDRLWEAVDRLARGSGVVFRHYSLDESDRLDLGLQLAGRASERNLALAVAGSVALADRLGAALIHNPDAPGRLPWSMAVHDEVQARAASQAGAALAFVGPVFPTRSHANRPALGQERAAKLAALAGRPAIALGGMDEMRFAELDSAHPGAFHGFAGIDCWLKSA